MRYFFSVFLVLLFLGCTHPEALHFTLDSKSEYFDLKSGLSVSEDEMIKRLNNYQVVFIGDHHDEANLYIKIATLIKKLSLTRKVHLASEWFIPSDDRVLASYIKGDTNQTQFMQAIKWEKRLGYAFDTLAVMYQVLAKEKGFLHGLNLSKSEQKKISKQNFKEMNREEKSFYDALDLNVTAHKQMLKPYFEDCHAYSDINCSERMYRVQVAWDSKMAASALDILSSLKEDEVLLVLVGSMHLQNKLGINLRFARKSFIPTYTLLPAEVNSTNIDTTYADGVLFYERKVK